jgi:hypothetical protein
MLQAIGWGAILLFFVWFGGFVCVRTDDMRLAWSEIGSASSASGAGHLIADLGTRRLEIGPYQSGALSALRCLIVVATLLGSVAAMRFVALPLIWRASDHPTRRAAAHAANSFAAQSMGALTLWWLAGTTLIFLAAVALPTAALPVLRLVGRVLVGAIVAIGPALIVARSASLLVRSNSDAPQRIPWLGVLVQLLASWTILVGLVLAGAAASLAIAPQADWPT